MTDRSRSPADDHEAARGPRQPRLPTKGGGSMSYIEFTRLRESIGTQDEVADELQTNRRTLGRWERGERPVPGIAAAAMKLLADKAAARRAHTQEVVGQIMAEQS